MDSFPKKKKKKIKKKKKKKKNQWIVSKRHVYCLLIPCIIACDIAHVECFMEFGTGFSKLKEATAVAEENWPVFLCNGS